MAHWKQKVVKHKYQHFSLIYCHGQRYLKQRLLHVHVGLGLCKVKNTIRLKTLYKQQISFIKTNIITAINFLNKSYLLRCMEYVYTSILINNCIVKHITHGNGALKTPQDMVLNFMHCNLNATNANLITSAAEGIPRN